MSERKSIWRRLGKITLMTAIFVGLAGSTGCVYERGGHGHGDWHHHDHWRHW